jgi:hypothetical protein
MEFQRDQQFDMEFEIDRELDREFERDRYGVREKSTA